MFSKYKKGGGAGPTGGNPKLQAIDGGQSSAPAATEDKQPAARRKPMQASKAPAQAAPVDKEKKRKERLSELKLELHKSLLENLNLGALETASEQDLRAEIIAISGEALEEMGVVLNREERATLNQDLYDEVTGLGPLEPLLKDESVNDILVNGPQQVFVERAGKLQLTDTTFKDEKHLLRIIDKIVSAVGRRVDESNPYVDARLKDGSRSTPWSRRLRWMGRWCPFVSSRRRSWGSMTLSASAPLPKRWRLTCRPPWRPAST